MVRQSEVKEQTRDRRSDRRTEAHLDRLWIPTQRERTSIAIKEFCRKQGSTRTRCVI